MARHPMTVVEFQPSLAQGLADLWNRSEEGWPGGFMRGIVKTSRDVLEQLEEVRSIANMVALEGGLVVGFASVFPFPKDPTAAYVGTVNVDPAYHGKGHGKALMRRAVEVAIEAGYWRIDLYTWPGNRKALPVYKNAGFVWVPDTHVYMQNFVPEIVAFEPLGSFFATHDWYATLANPVTFEEDGAEVEGMKVFEYRWAEGDDHLTVWVDQRSGAILGFEGPEAKVFLRWEDPSLLVGVRNALQLRVEARRVEVLGGSVRPSGVVGAQADQPLNFRADPVATVSFPFVLPADLEEVAEDEPPHRSTLEVEMGGRSFRLGLGVKVEKPLPVVPETRDFAVYGPLPRDLELRVSNNLGREVQALVKVRGRGTIVGRLDHRVTLAADGAESLRIGVRSKGGKAGVGHLRVEVVSEGLTRAPDTIPVPCLVPGQSVAYRLPGGRWAVESPTTRWEVDEYGGTVSLVLRSTGRTLLRRWGDYIGPPFQPAPLLHQRWGVKAHPGGRLSMRTTIPSASGAEVEKSLHLGGNLLTVHYTLRDPQGALDGRTFIPLRGRGLAVNFGTLTMPGQGKILREEVADLEFPDMWDDIPKEGLLDEGWTHLSSEGFGLGLAWVAPGPWRVEGSPWSLPHPVFALESKHGGKGPTLALLAPSEAWGETRCLWSVMALGSVGPSKREIQRIPNVALCPRVPLLDPEGSLRVEVTNPRRKPLNATLELELPPEIQATGGSGFLKGLDLGKAFAHGWRLRGPVEEGLRVFHGKAVLRSGAAAREEDLPLVVVPPPGPLSVTSGEGIWTLAHHPFTLKVAPSFAGAAISLEAAGRELLLSPYPEVGEFSWFRPWHGGLLPQFFEEDIPLDFHRQEFRARPVELGGWRGVRLEATLSRPAHKGLNLSVDYLVLPGAPLLALHSTLQNPTPFSNQGRMGHGLFLRPGGTLDARVHYLKEDWHHRNATDQRVFLRAQGRAAVLEPPGEVPCLAIVAATPESDFWVGDFGTLGRHPTVQVDYDLPQGGRATLTTYVALAPTVEAGKALAVMTNMELGAG